MCRTQNILENITNLISNAKLSGDLELAEKVKLSYERKKAKMVKPGAILKIAGFDKDIYVKNILEQSLGLVKFTGTYDSFEREFTQNDILKFIKDANINCVDRRPKEKVARVYTSLRKHTLDEFVKICSQLYRVSPRKAQWLKMIAANKLQCPVTGLKVSYCSYDVTPIGSYHYNFYSEDDRLFTVDHIIPKSKGGSAMALKNLQPMIGKYNWRKGSKDNEEFLNNNKFKKS